MNAEELRELADDLDRRAEQFEMAVSDIGRMDSPNVEGTQLLQWATKSETYEHLAAELRRRAERQEGA